MSMYENTLIPDNSDLNECARKMAAPPKQGFSSAERLQQWRNRNVVDDENERKDLWFKLSRISKRGRHQLNVSHDAGLKELEKEWERIMEIRKLRNRISKC